jgi:hypothetical protein
LTVCRLLMNSNLVDCIAIQGVLPKSMAMVVLKGEDVDFSEAKPVVSRACKFIIPIAALAEADPLVYPSGTEKSGQPITNWEGQPVGKTGIVFFNAVDKCYQAAPADGRSVIIINDVTTEQASALEEFARGLDEPVDNLSKASLERLLAHARIALGLCDMYNSDDDYIRSKMTPVHAAGAAARPSGYMKRDDRYICHTVFVAGPARFQGPTATPQEIPAHGAFIVRQKFGGRASFHMADRDVMLRTYLNADGSALKLSDFS